MVSTLDPKQKELLEQLSEQEMDLVMDTVKRIVCQDPETTINPLAQKLTGRTFTEEEQIKLELDTLMAYFQRRRQLLKGSLTASEVAKLLGTSRQTPHDRLKSQTLIGVLDNGSYRFPLWQFDPEGPDGVIPGLPAVLKALQVSDFAKLNWLCRPNPILGDLMPIAALKQGQIERVLQEASAIGDR
jgi:hypothetical protein